MNDHKYMFNNILDHFEILSKKKNGCIIEKMVFKDEGVNVEKEGYIVRGIGIDGTHFKYETVFDSYKNTFITATINMKFLVFINNEIQKIERIIDMHSPDMSDKIFHLRRLQSDMYIEYITEDPLSNLIKHIESE